MMLVMISKYWVTDEYLEFNFLLVENIKKNL